MTGVQVGSPAPDFSLPGLVGESDEPRQASLSDYRGKWAVLYFYEGVGRSVKETLRVLSALQTGANGPIERQPGRKTL